jgi:thiol-disulfide isomerase/thioredoxin
MAFALLIATAIAGSRSVAAKSLDGQERAVEAGRLLIGSPAPAFLLKTIDGREIDLAKLYGRKPVYLKFWATWCVPCRAQMPHLEHIYETAGSRLAVIAIDVGFNDSLEHVQAVREREGLNMPIVMDDGSLGRAFNLRVTPQHVVIGRSGRVLYVGQLADKRLEDALTAARASQPDKTSDSFVDVPSAKEVAFRKVGDYLPNISAKALDGQDFPLLDRAQERPTVLVFISQSCESYLAQSRPERAESCRRVREQIDSLSSEYSEVRWLGIASRLWTTWDDLTNYQNRVKVRIPLTLDESGDLFRSFHVMGVPTVLIADRQGRIFYQKEGFDPDLPSRLQRKAR